MYTGPHIITDGLILALDAGSARSYPGSGTTWYDLSGNGNDVTITGPTWNSTGYFAFDGTNDYCSTSSNLNLTSYNSVVVQVGIKTNNTNSSMFAFEHTINWNSNAGGFGLALHSNGSGNSPNILHTNHNSQVGKNYLFNINTDWSIHTNVFSKIVDATGRLAYVNGNLVPFAANNGYTTSTNTGNGSFANAIFYIGSRGGTGTYLNGDIAFVRVYGFKLPATEILQNYNALKNRFGL
tara:strand:+ start:25 stop:738 length:714 start_codon:yes stop_codon:yes gene_type:complete